MSRQNGERRRRRKGMRRRILPSLPIIRVGRLALAGPEPAALYWLSPLAV
jgi:hypothetical protein